MLEAVGPPQTMLQSEANVLVEPAPEPGIHMRGTKIQNNYE